MSPHEQRILDLVRLELRPDFVPPEYRNIVNSPYCGHCHHASLAMYFLLGGKQSGYKMCKAIDELEVKHYWLEGSDGEIIDPTAEQYTDLNRPLPYNAKVSTGVSYRKTKVTQTIINNVQAMLRQDQSPG